MKRKYFCTLTAVVLVVMAFSPEVARATDLIVEHNPTDPSHFSTIQSAIDYAQNLLTGPSPTTTSFRVVVEPDAANPYSGPITPISNVPIIGRETARTFISGGGAGTLITLNGVTNVVIKNFTIINAATGIDVSNSTTVKITGNVFQVGTGNVAVNVQNSPSAQIYNNTFYQNGTAITTNSDILITNNIFSGNGSEVLTQATVTQVTYNAYHNTTTVPSDVNSIPNATVANPDPLFVNPAGFDFHLKDGSPCHTYAGTNAGNPSYPNAVDNSSFDMGAYGGPDMDTIPFPVSIISSSATASAPFVISLQWSQNLSYLVTNATTTQGGYRVHYNVNKSGPPYTGTGAAEGNSPIDETNALSGTLNNLSSASTPSIPVVNNTVQFADGILIPSWPSSGGATGYVVYYIDFDDPLATEQSVDVAGATSATLGGLTNGHLYSIRVKAYTQNTYYVVVTAYDNTGQTRDPGVQHESDYSAPEKSFIIGDKVFSDYSNSVTERPERISSYPDLPNKGCFIATAAYGSYSASEVQALRLFRDRYLLTTGPGRAFVRWYYTYGPRGAQFLNDHPEWKPLVRTALLPAVGMALFLTHTTSLTKMIVLLLIGLSVVLLYYRKKPLLSGGVQ